MKILLLNILALVGLVQASTQVYKQTTLLESNVATEERYVENLIIQAHSGISYPNMR